MQPENYNQEAEQANQVTQTSRLHQVTPLSKYLAMALFIILPFVGGWIGYTFAPEKVVVVEKVTIQNSQVEDASAAMKNSEITLATNENLENGHIIRLDETESLNYIVDPTQLVNEEDFGFFGVTLVKIDDKYVVLRVLVNPSGIFKDYLVDESVGEVVREVTNYPRVFGDGLWGNGGQEGKHFYVSGNKVVVNDYVASTTEVIYEETEPSLTLVEEAGIGGAWGHLSFGGFEEYLVIGRFRSDESMGFGRFYDVVALDLRE